MFLISSNSSCISEKPDITELNLKDVFANSTPETITAAIDRFFWEAACWGQDYEGGFEILQLSKAVFEHAEIISPEKLIAYAQPYLSNQIATYVLPSENRMLLKLSIDMAASKTAEEVLTVLYEQVCQQLKSWNQMKDYIGLYKNLEVAMRFIKVPEFDELPELAAAVTPYVDDSWTISVSKQK